MQQSEPEGVQPDLLACWEIWMHDDEHERYIPLLFPGSSDDQHLHQDECKGVDLVECGHNMLHCDPNGAHILQQDITYLSSSCEHTPGAEPVF